MLILLLMFLFAQVVIVIVNEKASDVNNYSFIEILFYHNCYIIKTYV